MKTPVCPACEKQLQHRHTYMNSFPVTIVCTGCGSWVKLDVKSSGSLAILALCGLTGVAAFFSLYFLILLPLYFVLSMGPLQSFSAELIKKRKAELWTINRLSGALRPLDDAERQAQHDVQLSHKLMGVRPFRSLPCSSKPARKRALPDGHRPSFDASNLPTGLPN